MSLLLVVREVSVEQVELGALVGDQKTENKNKRRKRRRRTKLILALAEFTSMYVPIYIENYTIKRKPTKLQTKKQILNPSLPVIKFLF